MDVNMPLMDGIEATKRLARMHKESKLKMPTIVGCTAYSDSNT